MIRRLWCWLRGVPHDSLVCKCPNCVRYEQALECLQETAQELHALKERARCGARMEG